MRGFFLRGISSPAVGYGLEFYNCGTMIEKISMASCAAHCKDDPPGAVVGGCVDDLLNALLTKKEEQTGSYAEFLNKNCCMPVEHFRCIRNSCCNSVFDSAYV